MIIIGFVGKMGSGKSTACEYLAEAFEDVKRVNMKDGLVREMKERLPNVLDELVGNQNDIEGEWGDGSEWSVERLFQEKPPIMRALMQNYGTEVRRGDDPDYWVKQWKNTVDRVANQERFHVVCDDVRFLNEAKAVKEMGGVIVRIVRTDITDTGTHQSEIEMDQIKADYTVTAEKGQHQKLYSQLSELFDSL